MKREDLSGLALGGNKTRELEYFIGAALAEGADVFVAGGGVAQSNHAVQCSAAARRAGLKPVVVLRPSRSDSTRGNHLLNIVIGTDIRLIEPAVPGDGNQPRGEGLAKQMDRVADEYRARGNHPYTLHSSFHRLGAVGFVDCSVELTRQLREAGVEPQRIYLTSSGATQVGLALGNKALGTGIRVIGVRCGSVGADQPSRMVELGSRAAEAINIDTRLAPDDIPSVDFSGEGYGSPSPEGYEAMALLAETEGLFVDPVYSSKGLAGLIHHVRTGQLGRGETVVFVHTGGVGVMSAYGDEIVANLVHRQPR